MRVEVTNWKSYVKREDITRPGYFCFSVKFFTDPEFMGAFTARTMGVLAYLCSHGTRSKGVVDVKIRHVEVYLGISEAVFLSEVAILQELHLVTAHVTGTLRARDADLNGPPGYGTGQEGQDRRGTDTPEQAPDAPALPFQDIQPGDQVEPGTLIYDRDHESVALKPKPNELPRLAQIWNEAKAQELPPVLRCSPPRRRKIAARWKENSQEAFWRELFAKVNASSFLTGKSKPRDDRKPFRADLDWILEGSNIDKILEGKYDDSGRGSSASSTKSFFARQVEAKNDQQ